MNTKLILRTLKDKKNRKRNENVHSKDFLIKTNDLRSEFSLENTEDEVSGRKK